jgi:hypothetical protein
MKMPIIYNDDVIILPSGEKCRVDLERFKMEQVFHIENGLPDGGGLCENYGKIGVFNITLPLFYALERTSTGWDSDPYDVCILCGNVYFPIDDRIK